MTYYILLFHHISSPKLTKPWVFFIHFIGVIMCPVQLVHTSLISIAVNYISKPFFPRDWYDFNSLCGIRVFGLQLSMSKFSAKSGMKVYKILLNKQKSLYLLAIEIYHLIPIMTRIVSVIMSTIMMIIMHKILVKQMRKHL